MMGRRPPPLAALGDAATPLGTGRASPPDLPRSFPNPMDFATLKFMLIWPGPRPKLRGSSGSPGAGFGSNNPYAVLIKPGLAEAAAMPGRPFNSVVPKRSLFKGRPGIAADSAKPGT